MNFADIFKNSFLEVFAGNEVSAVQIGIDLFMTCLVGLYIFWVYRLVTRKTFYNPNYS